MNHVEDLRSDALSIWTVYDHPMDFPNEFVARRFVCAGDEPTATADVERSPMLGAIRAIMESRGLYRVGRMPGDDPKIVEIWL